MGRAMTLRSIPLTALQAACTPTLPTQQFIPRETSHCLHFPSPFCLKLTIRFAAQMNLGGYPHLMCKIWPYTQWLMVLRAFSLPHVERTVLSPWPSISHTWNATVPSPMSLSKVRAWYLTSLFSTQLGQDMFST
jgi:hypothetical protein